MYGKNITIIYLPIHEWLMFIGKTDDFHVRRYSYTVRATHGSCPATAPLIIAGG